MGIELFGPERVVERLDRWNEYDNGRRPDSAYIKVGSKSDNPRIVEVKEGDFFEDSGTYHRVKAVLRSLTRRFHHAIVVTERAHKQSGELHQHGSRPSHLSARYGREPR